MLGIPAPRHQLVEWTQQQQRAAALLSRALGDWGKLGIGVRVGFCRSVRQRRVLLGEFCCLSECILDSIIISTFCHDRWF